MKVKERKEWASMIIWTEFLERELELVRKGIVSEFLLDAMEHAYECTLYTPSGSRCAACRKVLYREDTKWRDARYRHPVCGRCISNFAQYGCD